MPWRIVAEQVTINRSRVSLSMPGDSMRLMAEMGKARLEGGLFDTGRPYYSVRRFNVEKGGVVYAALPSDSAVSVSAKAVGNAAFALSNTLLWKKFRMEEKLSADYIAVSVPEWRIVKPATHKQDIRYITHYIKNKKPEIDIHLLGCTDFKIIRENNFCTSADSTSWLSGVKYGYFNDGIKKEHIRNFKRSLYNEREAQVKAMMLARGIEPTGKKLVYTTNASLCATICKDLYARTCGPQD
mgnify:CR=1 FL=1